MLDFVYAGMHHSQSYNLVYPEAQLEHFSHPDEKKDKSWRFATAIDNYYNDYGYQDRDHIDKNALDKFIEKHSPKYGFINLVTYTLDTVGEYFHRNPAVHISKDVPHFTVQNKLNHVVSVDFALVSQVAAENGLHVCDLSDKDLETLMQKHRSYTVNNNWYYIRQAAREDLRNISELFKGDEEFGFISNHMINNFIQDSTCIAIVACDETTEIAGTYLAKITKENEIHAVYLKITDKCQGQGLGRALLDVLIRYGKELESPSLYGDCIVDGTSKYFFEHIGATLGPPKDNGQNKQKLVRWHYSLKSQEQQAFF